MASTTRTGLTMDLRLFGEQLHLAVVRRGSPTTDAERDDLLMDVLDRRVVPVVEIPWPDPPDMGWVLPALERLVETGRVRDLVCEETRCFMRRSVPPPGPRS